ncbi:MAG: DNA polymerase I [Ruminococcus sp.]|jgi:DNA polymerase-1|nr:DNA polymerase I [Ruminococcus sp.]
MKMLVIDGNSILNRAFYGIKMLTNKNGVFTNALLGFMNIYFKNADAVKPDFVAVAFDLKAPTFRHKAVASYKANRKGMPPELAQQLPLIKQILTLMGISVIEKEGFEADDILGTLSKICCDNNVECNLLTGDRDSLQLINNNVTVRLATTKETILYTPDKFSEDYGFEPILLIDLKALMGDSSDNISGVKGIGEKTAKALISKYGTVENIYNSLESLEVTKSVKVKLENGAESAKQSKWLATINCSVPLDNVIEHYRPSQINFPELSKLLSELEMFRLMDKIGISPSAATVSSQTASTDFTEINPEIININSENISQLLNLKSAAYTLENNKLSVFSDNNIFITDNINAITAFLSSDCEKSTNSAKAHYHFALDNNCELKNLMYDTEICGYLLNASASDYTVQKLCAEYNVHYYSENNEFAELLSIKPLISMLKKQIEDDGMTPLLHNIEMPLTEVLASMEHYGVKVDSNGVTEFGTELKDLIEETSQAVYDDAGHKFNISSPKQLGEVLFGELNLPSGKKTKTGFSTNADVLESLRNDNPIVDNVLKYRQYSKLNSTYVDGLLKNISSDGRIHTCFKQTETRTGRISSIEPNMQNIPVRTELGSRMRKFFVADSEKVLVDADYSQIELRVMAHLCGDENMIAAFNSGADIHTSTAAQVFNMPPEMVTSQMRSAAKAVNFGIIYGIGPFSLAKDINVPLYTAKKYIEDYLNNYPNVSRFMEQTVKSASETGFVSTMFGRKRHIPELLSSNKIVQAAGKRIAMNTPVQGTAADLIKIAMIEVYRRLKEEKLDAHLILQVHDELIVEASSEDSDRTAKILKEEMQNVCDMRVPLSVDVHKGESWYDAKG